jgi:LPPG:FO 2-phospho-L-lactate transferase
MYKDFVDKLIIDNEDKELSSKIKDIVGDVGVTNTMMKSLDIKKDLANFILKSRND